MQLSELKTIDVHAKEWWDKTAGNSYFSAKIVLNFGLENQEIIKLPFQYGYGDYYVQRTAEVLCEMFKLEFKPLWYFLDDYKVIIRQDKESKCKKKECIEFVA